MTTIVPCSTSNISLIPGTAFTIKNNNHLTKCSLPKKSSKRFLSSQRRALPLLTPVGFLPRYRRDCVWLHRTALHSVSATGTDTDVAVEETDSTVADENTADIPTNEVETSEKSSTNRSPAQTKRLRPGRKSEMPPVKDEDLIPGATFTGKVVSIQPFGAFVDFGAFTDGLVHVSRLSDSFVKDVAKVVSIGQEVTVKLVEANAESGRISLTMREGEDPKKQQQKDAPAAASSSKPRSDRRNTPKSGQRREDTRASKFVKGQELLGTVKNLTRSGTFISLPEGEEGFLPTSEEADGGIETMMGGTSMEVGQEVSVRVLRIARGQITLTMREEDKKSNVEFVQGTVHTATNPFVLAFRKNKDIASFLDEREKVQNQVVKPETAVESDQGLEAETESTIPEDQEQPLSSDIESVSVATTVIETVENETSSKEVAEEPSTANDSEKPESIDSSSLQGVVSDVQTVEQQTEESSGILNAEGSDEKLVGSSQGVEGDVQTVEQQREESSAILDPEGSDEKPVASEEVSSEVSSSEIPAGEEAEENQLGDAITNDGVQTEISSVALVEDEAVGASNPDENGSIAGSGEPTDLSPPEEAKDEEESVEISDLSASTDAAEVVSSESQDNEKAEENQEESIKDEVQTQEATAEAALPPTTQVQNEKAEPTPENSETLTNTNGQSFPTEESVKATISPALVKQLREETGAGMMDCKKALAETGGDIVKAQEFLRKKGLASADKKASRATAEGRIGSYIHDSRIGVLVEVNCETDFVSRGEIFKELVDDIAMQVAACPQVQYLAPEDVPEEIVNKEKDIEMQKEDLLSKPEQIRSKIVEGRIKKRLDDLALLEQPYIKNDKVVVKDLVKQTIATIGENIKVKRFVRFNLGEGLEKKSQDFAAEVAAQTAAKPVSAPPKEQPASTETKEPAEKAAVAISAALVKQLREETGAGMMDCKKALSETGGDLEKAQEYLRKKGLSAADKKSSRLAAEGRIGSYIHDSRIGVLIEVNCETDFVGRSEKFKELVDDLAMQVVACPQVQVVSVEDVPRDLVEKEKEIEMQREDLASKPEHIREKIVEGRISKRLGELALLEQPFIKDDSLLVKDLVKQTVAAIGENIKVRRFVRFTLGEDTADGAKPENNA